MFSRALSSPIPPASRGHGADIPAQSHVSVADLPGRPCFWSNFQIRCGSLPAPNLSCLDPGACNKTDFQWSPSAARCQGLRRCCPVPFILGKLFAPLRCWRGTSPSPAPTRSTLRWDSNASIATMYGGYWSSRYHSVGREVHALSRVGRHGQTGGQKDRRLRREGARDPLGARVRFRKASAGKVQPRAAYTGESGVVPAATAT